MEESELTGFLDDGGGGRKGLMCNASFLTTAGFLPSPCEVSLDDLEVSYLFHAFSI